LYNSAASALNGRREARRSRICRNACTPPASPVKATARRRPTKSLESAPELPRDLWNAPKPLNTPLIWAEVSFGGTKTNLREISGGEPGVITISRIGTSIHLQPGPNGQCTSSVILRCPSTLTSSALCKASNSKTGSSESHVYTLNSAAINDPLLLRFSRYPHAVSPASFVRSPPIAISRLACVEVTVAEQGQTALRSCAPKFS
jgi:hypothetical protein